MEEKVEIEYYETDHGKCPFLDWEIKLSQHTRDYLTVRLARIRMGNFGDCKQIKPFKGLYELRIHQRPGFRVYLGKKGNRVVILLCGGVSNSLLKSIYI